MTARTLRHAVACLVSPLLRHWLGRAGLALLVSSFIPGCESDDTVPAVECCPLPQDPPRCLGDGSVPDYFPIGGRRWLPEEVRTVVQQRPELAVLFDARGCRLAPSEQALRTGYSVVGDRFNCDRWSAFEDSCPYNPAQQTAADGERLGASDVGADSFTPDTTEAFE